MTSGCHKRSRSCPQYLLHSLSREEDLLSLYRRRRESPIVTACGTRPPPTRRPAGDPIGPMLSTLPNFTGLLAALNDGDPQAQHPLDRPVVLQVSDTYGDDVRLVLEGPRRIARAIVLPFLSALELVTVDGVLHGLRDGTPRPLKQGPLLEQLVAACAALPPDVGGGPYARLRRLCELDPQQCGDYLVRAVEAAGTLVPAYRPTRPDDRPEPLTAQQRKAASRARAREREAASVDAWLGHRRGLQAGRHEASALYDEALEWLETAADEKALAEEDTAFHQGLVREYREVLQFRRRVAPPPGAAARPPLEPPPPPPPSWSVLAAGGGYPPHPLIPSRRRFYELLDSRLGVSRVRSHGARFYELGQPVPLAI